MSNRIREVTVQPTRLTPTEAELAVAVEVESPADDAEVRGRLMGPTCLYSSTVEVAYPIRALPRPAGGSPALHGRVIIPEPSWWDTQSPFLYHGPVELWAAGRKVDERRIRCGLYQVVASDGRLVWNGRPLQLRAVAREHIRGDQLSDLRALGINLVVIDVGHVPALCDAADAVGVLLAGRAGDADVLARDPRYRPYHHPSVLGFVAGSGDGPLLLAGERGMLDRIPLTTG